VVVEVWWCFFAFECAAACGATITPATANVALIAKQILVFSSSYSPFEVVILQILLFYNKARPTAAILAAIVFHHKF